MFLKQANWIWCSGSEEKNCYVDFKQCFTCEEEAPAVIELSADGNYALYLNGCFVNSGQYPDYPEYKVFDRLDLQAFLKPGDNELLIRVYWPGEDHFSYRAEPAGLIFAVSSGERVLAQSGSNTQAAVNRAFQSKDVPKITAQLGYTFCYDASLAGTEQFEPAAVIEKKADLFPRPIHKVQIGDRLPIQVAHFGTFEEKPWETLGQRLQNAALAAKSRMLESFRENWDGTLFSAPEGDGIYLIIDLSAEQVGYLDLEFDLPEDALVIGGWGEHLEDLRVRAFVGKRNFAFSYRGRAGRNRFFMPLRRLGLRYLQLHIYCHSLNLFYAGIRPTVYPLQEYPISLQDRLHQKIYEVCIRTLRNCMHDHYEDTPWREQGLYTMDSRNEILCGYDIFHETDFPKACLRLIGLSVREDGMAELCSPARAAITIPSFTAIYLVELWEYLQYTDDQAFLLEMLPVAKRIAQAFEDRIDAAAGLLTAFPESCYWNYYEWQDGLSGGYGVKNPDELTYDAPLNAFVSMGFQALEQIYAKLGQPEEAAHCRQVWTALNEAMERTFWNGKWYHSFCRISDGQTFHDAQLTQALMICCKAVPAEKQETLRALLKSGPLLPVTLSYSIFKYEALMTDPNNFQWMMDDIAQIWGKMLFSGATTFWETAEGASDFHYAGSLCHGWSAVPLHLYHRYGTP